jgi:hypothetical protein
MTRNWEPTLPVELENDLGPPQEWTARVLTELARQLGVGNDYYYPLLSAAGMIRAAKQP